MPKGSPTGLLHQPRGTGGHSVNIHPGLGRLISIREGIKVRESVTALHVNSGRDENVTRWFCLEQYLAYSVPELVSCAVYFFC